MQARLAPRHAPLHARSRQPLAGVAVSVTGVYDRNVAPQRGRQVIPGRELRTVPRPVIETLSRKLDGAKNALTVVPA